MSHWCEFEYNLDDSDLCKFHELDFHHKVVLANSRGAVHQAVPGYVRGPWLVSADDDPLRGQEVIWQPEKGPLRFTIRVPHDALCALLNHFRRPDSTLLDTDEPIEQKSLHAPFDLRSLSGIDNKAQSEALECVLCCTNEKKVALVPCGHRATCIACTKSLASAPHCPCCRAPITGALVVFDA